MSGDDELLRLQWSVRALAQPADVQMALFPDFVEVADELVLDFDEHLRALTESGVLARLPEQQRTAIDELDKLLTAMSDADDENLWTVEALERTPDWASVRNLARHLIAVMGWSSEPPPGDRAIYVGAEE